MKEILANFKTIEQLSYKELLQVLIYKELEGSEVETSKTPEELEKFIISIANEWYENDYINLVPEEIHAKIFN